MQRRLPDKIHSVSELIDVWYSFEQSTMTTDHWRRRLQAYASVQKENTSNRAC